MQKHGTNIVSKNKNVSPCFCPRWRRGKKSHGKMRRKRERERKVGCFAFRGRKEERSRKEEKGKNQKKEQRGGTDGTRIGDNAQKMFLSL